MLVSINSFYLPSYKHLWVSCVNGILIIVYHDIFFMPSSQLISPSLQPRGLWIGLMCLRLSLLWGRNGFLFIDLKLRLALPKITPNQPDKQGARCNLHPQTWDPCSSAWSFSTWAGGTFLFHLFSSLVLCRSALSISNSEPSAFSSEERNNKLKEKDHFCFTQFRQGPATTLRPSLPRYFCAGKAATSITILCHIMLNSSLCLFGPNSSKFQNCKQGFHEMVKRYYHTSMHISGVQKLGSKVKLLVNTGQGAQSNVVFIAWLPHDKLLRLIQTAAQPPATRKPLQRRCSSTIHTNDPKRMSMATWPMLAASHCLWTYFLKGFIRGMLAFRICLELAMFPLFTSSHSSSSSSSSSTSSSGLRAVSFPASL